MTSINVRQLYSYAEGVYSSVASVIVFENGKSGFLGEHSCMDGTPTLRLNEFMLASLATGKIDLSSPQTSQELEPPKELAFTLDRKTRSYIEDAQKSFDKLVAQHDMEAC